MIRSQTEKDSLCFPRAVKLRNWQWDGEKRKNSGANDKQSLGIVVIN